MRKAVLAAGGIVALALLGAVPSASAGSLAGGGTALAGPAQAQAAVEDVRWVRRCYQVRRWWNGRPHWVTRCRNVWVAPRRW
ncbi:hypothetical protein EZH22_22030 [Xanthobacter dioxanivorans]|uniref:Uncharacterized protein n=1 Tax=Xanthobacter dioxanivorans TaxID=2528964 RepID=A0A974PM40_9HYPH|nr:hypothetical protein [Xanthobacter dioxanivorans]QRG05701.1 hypothetical protein EZH22_22030 [Xanthobacter dioxanivorans]